MPLCRTTLNERPHEARTSAALLQVVLWYAKSLPPPSFSIFFRFLISFVLSLALFFSAYPLGRNGERKTFDSLVIGPLRNLRGLCRLKKSFHLSSQRGHRGRPRTPTTRQDVLFRSCLRAGLRTGGRSWQATRACERFFRRGLPKSRLERIGRVVAGHLASGQRPQAELPHRPCDVLAQNSELWPGFSTPIEPCEELAAARCEYSGSSFFSSYGQSPLSSPERTEKRRLSGEGHQFQQRFDQLDSTPLDTAPTIHSLAPGQLH